MKPVELFLDIAERFFAPKVEGSRKVLVLEDDYADREALCHIIRSEGFEPISFDSQYDAERSMNNIVYVAGIFDLKLTSGYGSKAQQTFELKFPDVPTLIVTGDRDAVLKLAQDGLAVVLKGTSDFKSMTRAVRMMLRPIKATNATARWTTREVLLFLLIIALTNYGTWQLTVKLLTQKAP